MSFTTIRYFDGAIYLKQATVKRAMENEYSIEIRV
jgi:hypothetical protein